MSNEEDIQDPLKPLDKVCEPDERQKYFAYGLADCHVRLSALELRKAVPIEVRQLFETAKNLSLYSWFVYRFHQVSELIAFSALEMALRERYSAENPNSPPKARPRGLRGLLQHAKSEQWIANDGFLSLYENARSLATYRKAIDLIGVHDFKKESKALVEEPSDEEIWAALSDMNPVETFSSVAHKIRNELAHGSGVLHPNSISTLVTVSEAINQVFRK